MWCSIKNLCPAEVPSSSSCLLWGPKNLHNIFPEKSSAIFESIKLQRCCHCSKDNALTSFKRDFEGSRKRRFIQLEHGLRTPDKVFFSIISAESYPKFFCTILTKFVRRVIPSLVYMIMQKSGIFSTKKLSLSYILKKYLYGFGVWMRILDLDIISPQSVSLRTVSL